MKKKMMYRIELLTFDFTIAKDTAIVAALANGGVYNINLIGLQAYANVKKAEMPTVNKDVTVSLIGYTLLIDNGTENLLKVEQVEVMELDMPQITQQEAKDLLDELAPTLHRQSGIANPDHHENLN